ncbi:MAG: DUF5808 domain-containing protein [Nitrolancea sp.]
MKGLSRLIRLVGIMLVIAAIADQLRRPADERTWTGNILIFPYDFRFPTVERFFERWWNPEDERIFTPDVFGVGWSVNLFQAMKRFKEMG